MIGKFDPVLRAGGRRLGFVLATFTLTLVFGACGSRPVAHTTPVIDTVRTEVDVEYVAGLRLDVIAPRAPGQWPVVVLLHGCCTGKEGLTQFALALAARGVVVYNTTWQNMNDGGGYPHSHHQIECAVQYARSTAAQVGGDPSEVTLVGWGDGALVGAVVALAGNLGGECGGPAAHPDAFVGISGFYGWPEPAAPVDPRFVTPRSVRFFGGTPDEASNAWISANPYAYTETAPAMNVRLIAGSEDVMLGDACRFVRQLVGGASNASLTVVDGGQHDSVVIPRLRAGAVTVEAVVEALRSGADANESESTITGKSRTSCSVPAQVGTSEEGAT